MKVEIDDRRLKQLYNIESYAKDIFPKVKGSLYIGITEVEMMQNILKPISNRPTLDELSDVYESAYSKRFSTCTNWTQARNEATIRAVIKVLDALILDYVGTDLDQPMITTATEYRDGYKKDIADD